jgi:hypothetical protein
MEARLQDGRTVNVVPSMSIRTHNEPQAFSFSLIGATRINPPAA